MFTTHIELRVISDTRTTRGDHYEGHSEYYMYEVVGEATVRDVSGRAVAVCPLGYGNPSRSNPTAERAKGYFEPQELIPDRQGAFADWIAQTFVAHFQMPDQQGAVPRIVLIEPSRNTLVELGFVLDQSGQVPLFL